MAIRFCPHCGAPLAPRAHKPGDPDRMTCGACDYVHFPDPKVAAGCIVERDGGIVLLRRAIEPGYGKWVFPGGYVDRGERVDEAARRETLEECRLEVRVTSLLNVYSYAGRPVIVVVYTAETTGGVLEAADESLEARTFSPDAIPWDELAFPSTFEALRDYLRARHSLAPPAGATPPNLPV
jgi:ADP-ribose pyrophosphatase YjhB (NUDIX family)